VSNYIDLADSSAQLLSNLKARYRLQLHGHGPLSVFNRHRTLEVTGSSWITYLMVRCLAFTTTRLTQSSAADGADSAGFSYIRVPLGASDFSAYSTALLSAPQVMTRIDVGLS
jgi:hypothetical protein